MLQGTLGTYPFRSNFRPCKLSHAYFGMFRKKLGTPNMHQTWGRFQLSNIVLEVSSQIDRQRQHGSLVSLDWKCKNTQKTIVFTSNSEGIFGSRIPVWSIIPSPWYWSLNILPKTMVVVVFDMSVNPWKVLIYYQSRSLITYVLNHTTVQKLFSQAKLPFKEMPRWLIIETAGKGLVLKCSQDGFDHGHVMNLLDCLRPGMRPLWLWDHELMDSRGFHSW